MKHTRIILFIFCSIAIPSFSQEGVWEEQVLDITKGQYMQDFYIIPNAMEDWTAIVVFKKKTGIYNVRLGIDIDVDGNDSLFVEEVTPLIQPIYDDIQPFERLDVETLSVDIDELGDGALEYAVVRKKKKVGIIYRVLSTDMIENEYQATDAYFDDIEIGYYDGIQVPVSRKNKWGLYDWYHQTMIIECEYDAIEEFPSSSEPNGMDEYTFKIVSAFNKHKDWEEINNIDLDNGNGDGIFLAQSKATNKYGMYQYIDDKTIIEAIPMQYDSIYYYPWNGSFTAVFNNGKVGFYLSYWSYDQDSKESVPCIYEDYKVFNKEEDNTKVLAVKKDGKWGWIDWLTGEEKSEFTFETSEDLPYPYYEQKYWVEK